jgi:hypothetical protein
MHEIYIVNKNINNKFILNFKNNKLYEKNTLCKTENDYINKEEEYRINSYKFEIINKNELNITGLTEGYRNDDGVNNSMEASVPSSLLQPSVSPVGPHPSKLSWAPLKTCSHDNLIDIENVDFLSNNLSLNPLSKIIPSIKVTKEHIIPFSNEIYYTEDSYIYILKELFNEYKNIYLKLFLKHDNWNDQIIVDLNKKIITRIKHNDQIGKLIEYNGSFRKLQTPADPHPGYLISEDRMDGDIQALLGAAEKLIIDWERWGHETFIKIDDKSYVKEYSKFLSDNVSDNILKKNLLKSSIPIYIFIHICTIENWKEIFEDQIKYLKISGLYEESTYIYIGILGELDLSYFSTYPKLTILYYDTNVELYEIPMINHIANISKKSSSEINILYIHTKGVRRAGNDNVIWSWRKMMEYFLIINYKLCIKNLEYYDTLGCNAINELCENIDNVVVNKDKNHTYHYSGNFWWSKKSYIEKLPFLQIDMSDKAFISRYKAENWILSEYPNGKFGILFQDDTNIHPYHRYVFEYYKDLKIIIIELK